MYAIINGNISYYFMSWITKTAGFTAGSISKKNLLQALVLKRVLIKKNLHSWSFN